VLILGSFFHCLALSGRNSWKWKQRRSGKRSAVEAGSMHVAAMHVSGMQVSGPWTWLYSAWVASEVLIAIATRTRRGGGEVRDRGTQVLLWIVIIGSIAAVRWTTGAVAAPIFGRAHWLRVAGLLLLAAGLAIRWAAILNLGSAFSANVAIRKAQRVRTTGLYRYVRHPSYLGLVLIFLAIGIYSRNGISLAIAVVPPTLALLYRIQVEETALREAFGEEYIAYSRTTKRLFPGIY
jgi:protein-S-isoprenylcysteine O-methyltransferase Ste14